MRPPLRHLVLPLGLVLSVAAAAPARADDDPAAAKEHYQRGTKLYDILKYREAAREFEAAYQAKADPAFLYNMGQAYRLAGDAERAMGAYRSYLRRVPEARNRKEVEDHITELQRVLDQERRARDRAPADTQAPGPLPDVTTPSPTPRPATTPGTRVDAGETAGAGEGAATPRPIAVAPVPRDGGAGTSRGGFTKKVAGGVIAGVGVAALGVGAAFAAMAQSASNQITNAAPGSTFDPSLEEAFKTDRTLAIAMLAGGGVALAAGVTVLLLGVREGRGATAMVVPVLAPGRVGAALDVRF